MCEPIQPANKTGRSAPLQPSNRQEMSRVAGGIAAAATVLPLPSETQLDNREFTLLSNIVGTQADADQAVTANIR